MVNGHTLPLCIITSNLDLISEADQLNVDRIMIDLEYIGKDQRQVNKNLFISNQKEFQIHTAKSILKNTKLMVRINPIHSGSEDEINRVIEAGADIIMLPYFSTVEEVNLFIGYISCRCKTNLLVETKGAVENIHDIINIRGIDEIHVGLNDLHISLNNQTIFDVIFDGTLEKLAAIIQTKNIRFGYGGVAPPTFSMPTSPEAVIAEQIRLKSRLTFLSRRVSLQLEINNYKKLSDVIAQIEEIALKWQLANSEDFLKNRENFKFSS